MRLVVAGILGLGVIVATACGSGSEADGSFNDTFDAGSDASSSAYCTPGEVALCTCPNGSSGHQSCTNAGGYDVCKCDQLTNPEPDSGPAVCGDHTCAKAESCKTCPTDCGDCPKCNLAPSCSDGLALPSQPGSIEFDALSKPADPPKTDAGAPIVSTCSDAQLRMRISRIEVGHQAKEVWLPTGTISGPPQSYYCIIQASDGIVVGGAADAGSNGTVEVALTKVTAQIADNTGADFAPADSIFWGGQGPRLTHSNLTVTYSCFQQKDPGSDSWSKILKAAGDAAGGLANSGPYGWAFGLGSIGLQVAGAAVDAAQQQGDWHMFDVTQTIDKSWLLPLTNGYVWSFKQGGGEQAFQYPWGMTVYVESWGCADLAPGSAH